MEAGQEKKIEKVGKTEGRNEAAEIIADTSAISVNTNGLHSSIKCQRLSE